MKIFTNFDEMLTPKIIALVYYTMIVAIIIYGVNDIFNGYGNDVRRAFADMFKIFGGIIAARIICELMIVIFKINENLQSLSDQKSQAS